MVEGDSVKVYFIWQDSIGNKIFSSDTFKVYLKTELPDLKQNIFNDIKEKLTAANGFVNEKDYLTKLDTNDVKTIFNDSLILFQNTSLRDTTSLEKIYFSDKFFNCINSELATNISLGIQEVINTNTSQRYLDFRKLLAQHPNYKKLLVSDNGITMTRQQVVNFMKIARKDYNRHLKTFNK